MFVFDLKSVKAFTAGYSLHGYVFYQKELHLLFPFPSREQINSWMPIGLSKTFPQYSDYNRLL